MPLTSNQALRAFTREADGMAQVWRLSQCMQRGAQQHGGAQGYINSPMVWRVIGP